LNDILLLESSISISFTNSYSKGLLDIFTWFFEMKRVLLIWSTIFCYERSFLDRPKGKYPVANSHRVTPTLQTSHNPTYFILTPFNIYGAMYCGVPAKVTLLSTSMICVASPKSAILICLFLIRMLAGLMSRWMNPFEVK